ncbi:neuronal regeneration-related protein isoform X2 [Cebus imitator]|uniref:Neuronal regeneration-related protein n=1 Tax=Sapajus apella TaxID=9515 RepID=A0A6J3HJX1_SAPAP|nr:neuronal regeneration-related protein isoform X2 [Sapajus apella]XP_037593911.1 neuronal regeneration-related protein isoform X2 [Cebus imitator]
MPSLQVYYYSVERRESEQGAGLLSVHYPELLVWVNQEPFPNKEMEGRLPKGRLPVPKEVNWKKDDETNAASLPPLGSNELRSPRISYLHFF